MVINAVLDFFSVASFLPLILLLVNPALLQANPPFALIYSASGASSPTAFIVATAVGILVFAIVKNLLSLAIARRKAKFCFNLGSALSSRMLSRLAAMHYSDYVHLDYSKEINRIANLPLAFANNIILPLCNLLSEGLVFLILIALIALYQVQVFLLLFAILAPLALFYQMRRRSIHETSRNLKEKYPLTLKYALQLVEGFVEMKMSGKESFFKDRFKKASEGLADTFVNDHVNQTSALRITEIVAAFVICLLILFAVLTHENYQQTILLLGVYAGVSFRLIPSVNRILNSFTQIRSHEFLFQELDSSTTESDKSSTEAGFSLPFTDTLTLDQITFQFPGGPPILDRVSLTIHKGEKIALTGKSGSGKTTLLMVLMKFLEADSGELKIDGANHAGQRTVWRRLFGYVSQSPYIVDASIAENIAFGVSLEKIDTEKVSHLLAELDLKEIVDQFPEGIHTPIGENGVKLSGGQRQRIAIARALYHDAEILLFDEITNQLDVQTEKEILTSLEKIAWQKKTIVMITHHPHLLPAFDRVLVLENGSLKIQIHHAQ
jgi:ABC-type bacteriocin/lantibiotic exporter with double-glycine peptidase domain